jgi:hypothetical protein
MVNRARGRLAPLFMVWTLIACGAGSAACAAVFGFERLTEDGAPPEAGSTETSMTNDADVDGAMPEAGPTCAALGIPDRPLAADGGADALAPIHMAVKLLDFGIDTSASVPGFNLDHACSPTVATSTCATKIDEATFDTYGKDKNDRGVDNSGYSLLAYISYLDQPAARRG